MESLSTTFEVVIAAHIILPYGLWMGCRSVHVHVKGDELIIHGAISVIDYIQVQFMQWPAGGSSRPQSSCFRKIYFICSLKTNVVDLFVVFFELLTDPLPLHTWTGDFIKKLLQYGWQLGRDEQLSDSTRKLSWKSFSFWHCSNKTSWTAWHENH